MQRRVVRRPVEERQAVPREPLDLSVVLPVLNEQDSLDELYRLLKRPLNDLGCSYEILFVDDGSEDGSWEVLKRIAANDLTVRLIRHRRNFGKASALANGFQYAAGDVVVTMDADLQDDPAEIPNLLQKIDEGYDVVSGWKKVRHDTILKRLASKLFNFATRRFSGIRLHDFNCGLKAYRWMVAKELATRSYGELHRYLPVTAFARGFRVTEIPVKHHRRPHGDSRYGAARYLRGLLDLFTITFLSNYFERPLHLFGSIGMALGGLGTVGLLYLGSVKLFLGVPVGERPLLPVSTMLVVVGIQIFAIGLVAELIRSAQADSKQDNKISEVVRVERRVDAMPSHVAVDRRQR